MHNDIIDQYNEKLVKWLGWQFSPFGYWYDVGKDAHKKRRPNPRFTDSLDLCFKWLVPKLIEQNRWSIQLESKPSFPNTFFATISDSLNPHLATFRVQADTPALALCFAIAQLIDKEKGEK